MFNSDKAKRKNDDKPKGLPRRRMQLIAALLIAAAVIVAASLLLRASLPPAGPSGHLYYKTSTEGFVLDFATGQHARVDNPSQMPRPPLLDFSPTSPDGKWRAEWELTGYEGTLVINSIGRDTINRVELGDFHTGGTFMTWSPDSQWLVFSANTDPIVMMPYPAGNEELFRVNIETKQTEQLTFNNYLDQWPAYSPDGTQIAYVAAHDGYRRLWIMDVATKESTLLTPNMFVYIPTWSPDGRWIAFMTDHADRAGDVWIIRNDGSEEQPIVIGPDNARDPVWLP